MEKFMKVLGTTKQLSTAYHPQTDRQTERINQEVGTFLQYYVNYQQDNWMEWLAVAEFSYNDKKHTIIGQIQFKLNFGRHPWKGNLMVQMEFLKLEEFLIGLQKSWEEATKSIEIVQGAMKKQFNKKRRNPQGLKVEDNMWLESKNIHSNRPLKKLDQKRYRPFRILKEIGQGAFQLKLPEGWMIYDVFNEDLLTRCKEPHYQGQHMEPAPQPTIINEDEDYTVEEVWKHRKEERGMQYLVH